MIFFLKPTLLMPVKKWKVATNCNAVRSGKSLIELGNTEKRFWIGPHEQTLKSYLSRALAMTLARGHREPTDLFNFLTFAVRIFRILGGMGYFVSEHVIFGKQEKLDFGLRWSFCFCLVPLYFPLSSFHFGSSCTAGRRVWAIAGRWSNLKKKLYVLYHRILGCSQSFHTTICILHS